MKMTGKGRIKSKKLKTINRDETSLFGFQRSLRNKICLGDQTDGEDQL